MSEGYHRARACRKKCRIILRQQGARCCHHPAKPSLRWMQVTILDPRGSSGLRWLKARRAKSVDGGSCPAVPFSRRLTYKPAGMPTSSASFLFGLRGPKCRSTAARGESPLYAFYIRIHDTPLELAATTTTQSKIDTQNRQSHARHEQVHLVRLPQREKDTHAYPRFRKRRAHPTPAVTAGVIRGNRVRGPQAPMRRSAPLQRSLAPGTPRRRLPSLEAG